MKDYKGIKVEFHILQSFPVTCLNRDDVGSPKSAWIGGVPRARVSSQAWKRQVRMAMHDFGIKLACRTKLISSKIEKECLSLGANEKDAQYAGDRLSKILANDTLYFFSDSEARGLAEFARDQSFFSGTDEKSDADFSKAYYKDAIKAQKAAGLKGMKALDGLDIALFGRMVANSTTLNIEAASSFAHAISTHKVSTEIEFFTALDDFKAGEADDAGASHMGSLEFNSATYYRYISLDVAQLVKNLGDDSNLAVAVSAFIKALFVAVPYARQATQTGCTPWDFAHVYVRKGQRVQASFDNPVKAKGEGFLKPSIDALEEYLSRHEKMAGSLFQKKGDFVWGKDDSYDIDKLISDVVSAIEV